MPSMLPLYLSMTVCSSSPTLESLHLLSTDTRCCLLARQCSLTYAVLPPTCSETPKWVDCGEQFATAFEGAITECIKVIESVAETESSLTVRNFATAVSAVNKFETCRDLATLNGFNRDGSRRLSQDSKKGLKSAV